MRESTALAAYGRVQDVQSFIRELGENIAKSQMFGCENLQQGYVLATACVAKGKDPLSLAEDYHIIHGRLSMRSDRMLAGLMERGGKYRMIARTSEEAAIEITYDGQSQTFRLTWQEAQQEGFANWKDKKTGEVKVSDNYSTPRKRMQMLWARVVSDGVRVMCPTVLSGRYTPEELSDENTEAIEGDFAVCPGVSVAPAVPNATEPPKESVIPRIIGDIKTLYDRLGVPQEKRDEVLKKYGTGSLLGLTQDQAEELLERLRVKFASTPRETVVPKSESIDAPCPSELSDKIKSLLSEICQVAGYEDVASKVKLRLQSAGLSRLTELTIAEAERLHLALQSRQMAAFFDANLVGYKSKN